MYLHQLTTTERSRAIRLGFRGRLAALLVLAFLSAAPARADGPEPPLTGVHRDNPAAWLVLQLGAFVIVGLVVAHLAGRNSRLGGTAAEPVRSSPRRRSRALPSTCPCSVRHRVARSGTCTRPTTTEHPAAIRPGFRGWPAALIALALLAVPAARAEAPAETGRVEDSFLSGGEKIAVERYQPAAKGKHPAILLLPAIDGLDKAHGDLYRRAARRYADKGYVVLLVNYFDRTPATLDERKALRESFFRSARGTATPAEEEVIEAHFRDWMGAVADAAKYARGLPNVDGDHVGLVGFSLGAYLALASAADKRVQVSAVVELFGGLPRSVRDKAANLPPTLILHGDADTVVPVTEAYALRRLLRKAKRVCEFQVYPEVGHVFSDPDDEGQESKPLSWEALLRMQKQVKDADERIAAFLDKYLKPVPRRAAER
jgi:carboxymethylenebutenolidase